MKAQVITQFGEPSVFVSMDIPKPMLIPGHVLIRVLATSVNPIDCKIRAGMVPEIAPALPAVLHGDVVGVIEEIGDGVIQFKRGDEVYGFVGGVKGAGGALAEYMLADATLLAKKPKALSLAETAALPIVSITAWEALFSKAKLSEGQNILIHGGVGGVGHIAVQLAKWAKANVYTTVLAEDDINLAKSFGADFVINAREESVEDYVQRYTDGMGFDVVFDTVGGLNIDRSLQATKINGAVVTTSARSTHDLSVMHNKGLSLHVVFTLNPLLTGLGRAEHGQILMSIQKLADAGYVRPLVDSRLFKIDQVEQAHMLLESGGARGKVVMLQE